MIRYIACTVYIVVIERHPPLSRNLLLLFHAWAGGGSTHKTKASGPKSSVDLFSMAGGCSGRGYAAVGHVNTLPVRKGDSAVASLFSMMVCPCRVPSRSKRRH